MPSCLSLIMHTDMLNVEIFMVLAVPGLPPEFDFVFNEILRQSLELSTNSFAFYLYST